MTTKLLTDARDIAMLIGTRIQITIPSILAEGEFFAARISVTGNDALPLAIPDLTLNFTDSTGVSGLPQKVVLGQAESTACIGELQAIGPETVLIRAQVTCGNCTGQIVSNPAWVFRKPAYRIYFGDLHIHTTYSNCSAWRCLPPEWCYEYARDVALLDFAAPADHLRGIAYDPQRWPHLQKLAQSYNSDGNFVTFLACESSHAQGFGGDNNVYFLEDDAPHFWVEREDMKGAAPRVHLQELWQSMDRSGKSYFTVPHHTGRTGKYRDWSENYHDPVREPLFEIYSSWGSSEMRHSRLPISGGNNDAPAYFVDALRAGARFGVIASSDDHATLPGSVHQFRINPFQVPALNGFAHKGLAAVKAPVLSRQALFNAMRQRMTYATTHARSLIDMTIGEASMGMACPADSNLRARRTIEVRFTLDNAQQLRITLMRNGEALSVKEMNGPELMTKVNRVEFLDTEPLESIALQNRKYHAAPFVVYYVRFEDQNGAHQWTSPIWIDC